EQRLAGAGRTEQQDRRRRSDCDSIELLHDLVERTAARWYSRGQERSLVKFVTLKSRRETVVLRQIEIDDRKPTGIASSHPARRTRLQEPRRDVARLGQQKEANLRDVRSRRDVDEVILGVGIKRVRPGEIVQAGVHLLEVPRIDSRIDDQPHFGFRRDVANVVADGFRQTGEGARVQQFEAVDEQILVLTDRNAGTPAFPAPSPGSPVDRGAEKAQHDRALGHSQDYKAYL